MLYPPQYRIVAMSPWGHTWHVMPHINYLFQTRAFDWRLPVSVFERWCWVFHRWSICTALWWCREVRCRTRTAVLTSHHWRCAWWYRHCIPVLRCHVGGARKRRTKLISTAWKTRGSFSTVHSVSRIDMHGCQQLLHVVINGVVFRASFLNMCSHR